MQISLVYNYIQIIGWAAVLIVTLTRSVSEETIPLQSLLCLLQLMQVSQSTDLIFNIMGVTSGSILTTSMQLFGRLLVAFYYMQPEVCFCSMRNAIIPWSIAEIIRFSFYIDKQNKMLTFLRYNAFMILYPIGISGELRTINAFLEKFEIEEGIRYASRALQVLLVVGMAYLYSYMLKQRKKYQQLRNGSTQTGNVTKRAKSPTKRE